MEKGRFNEIINLLIGNLAPQIGICSSLSRLCLKELITNEEDREIMTMLNITFHEMKLNGESYDFNGKKSEIGRYAFSCDEDRIEFLKELMVN